MELNSLEKGMLILKELAVSERPLRAADIAQLTDLNRSTVHRLCDVLERGGWIRRVHELDGQRAAPYDLGFAAHGLAVLITNKYDTTAKLEPVITTLARTLGEAVHVGVLDFDKVVHVARALPHDGPNMAARVGSREFAHVTALGKVLLAASPRETLDSLFIDEELPVRGARSIKTRTELLKELDSVAQRGYAVDDEESRPGIRCIAAPLFGPDGTPLLAISVTAMATTLTDHRVPEVAEAVKAAATLATASFGGHAPIHWTNQSRPFLSTVDPPREA